MVNEMEFEKPVYELKKKIAELKEFTQNSDVDLSKEIEKLENRLQKLQNDIYENMKPWERVQVARHPDRPTTLDYIEISLLRTSWKCTETAPYGDDEAIVSGVGSFTVSL